MGFENGKVLRVALQATAGENTQVNTLHYDLEDDTTSGGANDPQSLADFFRDNVVNRWGQLFGAGWSIQPVVVTEEKDPLDPFAPRGQWTSGSAFPGTKIGATEHLPVQVCALAKLPTDHIGRRYTGRMFIGGSYQEGDNADGGNLTASIITVIQEFLDNIPRQPDISSGPSLSTARWSVYSRTQRAADRDPYLSKITTPVLRPTWHWLRSRGG